MKKLFILLICGCCLLGAVNESPAPVQLTNFCAECKENHNRGFLSSFYAKRNTTTAVILTWSTESELDNAGFNISRSNSRTGKFTKINAQLIPGAGTTGKKNTYTWTDTSAKPDTLYYYQIEDVSLEGEHRTLRTTRLRGHVGAAGKVTLSWAELKNRK